MEQVVRIRLHNLTCAHCAEKIDRRLSSLPFVTEGDLNFTIGQIRLKTDRTFTGAELSDVQALVDSIERGVTLSMWDQPVMREMATAAADAHGDCCGYLHAHAHDHGFGGAQEHRHGHTHGDDCGDRQAHGDCCGYVHGEDGGHEHAHGDCCGYVHGEDGGHEHAHGDCCGYVHGNNHGDEHTHTHDHWQADTLPVVITEGGAASSGEKMRFWERGSYKIGVAALSALLIAAAYMMGGGAVIPLALTAILLCGTEIFIDGVKNLFSLNFDEKLLLTIAVVAACVIGEWMEAGLVTLLFFIGEILEDRAVGNSRRSIEALMKIRPDTANLVLSDGSVRVIPAGAVRVGDHLLIKAGEQFAVDCRVILGESAVDCSALTGESLPQNKSPGDDILSGSLNTYGVLTCEATRLFEDSAASKIIRLVEESAAKKGETEKFITRFARVYTPIVMVLCLVVAVVPPLMGLGSFEMWLMRALVFLVASCPCALVISVPLAFYSGIGTASKRGVLIKGGKYLEALRKADCFVFDKTGTLTTGKLSIAGIYPVEGVTEERLLRLAASAERYSNHPLAQSISGAYHGEPVAVHSSSELAGHGIEAHTDEGTLLCGNARLMTERGVTGVEDHPGVLVALGGKYIGHIEVADTLREESADVIRRLGRRGRTVMLTGDGKAAAGKVAEKIGLSDYVSDLLPDGKLAKLRELQHSHTTVFVGDGINDAPVLSAADCGVAMGLGSDAALENADVILASDQLGGLVQAIDIAKAVNRIVRFNIWFALIVKVAVFVLGTLGYAQMWMAVFADVGVSILSVLNAVRLLRHETK